MGVEAPETASGPSSATKRKAPISFDNPLDNHGEAYDVAPLRKKRAQKTKGEGFANVEKRLRRYRSQPPNAFDDIYLRATTQKFFVLGRTRCGTADCPEELVELTGSTGNIYNVVIARQPACDCPHGAAGNQCKHIVFVLARVLRATYEHVYQLALLSAELRDIFSSASAPLNPEKKPSKNDTRKPVDGDCPICFDTMDANNDAAIVWCRAACGQNIHKNCFQTWASTKRRQGEGDVTCPYCRSVWKGDDSMLDAINKTGPVNSEGYVNVADQLGISHQRDYSTYSRFWRGHPNAYRRRNRGGYGS